MKATIIVAGRLTRDVTSLFQNEDGSAKRALFTVACNSIYNKDNEKVKTTDFIPCIAWGTHADLLKEWGLKGRQVLIKGTLETYQKPPNEEDGSYEPTKVQVRVEQIEFLGFEDNVREKYEAKKAAAGTATPAGTEALLAGLAKLLGAATPQAAPVAAPPPPEPPKPAAAGAPSAEALAAALLGVINSQAAPVEAPPDLSAGVADELGTLI